jgi:mRNA interferase MazF
MKEADVALTPIPQADGTIKNRPVVLLRELPPYQDFLVCGISTQLHQEVVGFDDVISPDDSDFIASGLRGKSLSIKLIVDRFFLKQRNRVSVVNIKVNCESEKETRFLSPLSGRSLFTRTQKLADRLHCL